MAKTEKQPKTSKLQKRKPGYPGFQLVEKGRFAKLWNFAE